MAFGAAGGHEVPAAVIKSAAPFLAGLVRFSVYGYSIRADLFAKAIETPRSNLYKKLDAYGISRKKDDDREAGE